MPETIRTSWAQPNRVHVAQRASDGVTHEPRQVLVPRWECTVCFTTVEYRSELDHDGRCDDCRP